MGQSRSVQLREVFWWHIPWRMRPTSSRPTEYSVGVKIGPIPNTSLGGERTLETIWLTRLSQADPKSSDPHRLWVRSTFRDQQVILLVRDPDEVHALVERDALAQHLRLNDPWFYGREEKARPGSGGQTQCLSVGQFGTVLAVLGRWKIL